MVTKRYLKHLLNVVVFGFEQLAPGRQVAVGEDAAGLQHPVSMTLQTRSISPLSKKDRLPCVHQMKHNVCIDSCFAPLFSFLHPLFMQTIPSIQWLSSSRILIFSGLLLRNLPPCCALILTTYLNKIKLVSMPCVLWQRVCIIQDT